jgi:hypothetical protein
MKHLMQGFFSRVSGFVDTRGATWHGVRHYDRIKQNRDLSLQVPSGSALGRLVDLFALSIWNKLMFSYVACWASKWPKQECPGHTKGINADDVPPLHKTHHLTKHKVRGASIYCMEQYCTLEFVIGGQNIGRTLIIVCQRIRDCTTRCLARHDQGTVLGLSCPVMPNTDFRRG